MTSQTQLGALFLLATLTWLAPVAAQSIYKCGNTFGQTPCAGGMVIDADDSRTPAQKAQSDQATKEARQIAANMEKDRLKAEKAVGDPPHGKNTPSKPPVARETTAKTPKAAPSRKKAGPEYFTAAIPPEEPKPKKSSKKPGGAAVPGANENL